MQRKRWSRLFLLNACALLVLFCNEQGMRRFLHRNEKRQSFVCTAKLKVLDAREPAQNAHLQQ